MMDSHRVYCLIESAPAAPRVRFRFRHQLSKPSHWLNPVTCSELSWSAAATALTNDCQTEYSSRDAAKMKFSIPTEKDTYVLDDTGTEVDEEVFSDILEEKTDILWTIVDTLSVTGDSPASSCTDTLSLSSRSSESDTFLMSPKRHYVDDIFLTSPKRPCIDDGIPKSQKSQHIDDSSSQAKEEHFYDADSNEGYIAWKLKNTQRELSGGSNSGVHQTKEKKTSDRKSSASVCSAGVARSEGKQSRPSPP
ncbi:uncharacterized protein LOC119025641 [Scomber scombrus]|uniref:Uncharacterized protein LOC119025641 n=1 Tax=Scomber scombrus TaxID=13677 RepID=A0AAV1QEM9_SCOSC